MKTKEDISMRTEYTGAVAITSGVEYICNIANRLFFMIPGMDDYNKKMGLDIMTQAKQQCEDGYRDTAYEEEIASQFSLYTDIIPSNVVAVFMKKILMIYMDCMYHGESFKLGTSSDPKKFATQILPKKIWGN